MTKKNQQHIPGMTLKQMAKVELREAAAALCKFHATGKIDGFVAASLRFHRACGGERLTPREIAAARREVRAAAQNRAETRAAGDGDEIPQRRLMPAIRRGESGQWAALVYAGGGALNPTASEGGHPTAARALRRAIQMVREMEAKP